MNNSPSKTRIKTSFLCALFLVAGPLLVSGCSSATDPVFTTWEGNLIPDPPNFIGGRVAAVTQFGRTQISIQIEEAESETTYGWRVNAGTCQEEGEIQGGVAAYPSLTPSETGTATGDTTIAGNFKNGGAYAARVFQSVGGGEVIVACGNLLQT